MRDRTFRRLSVIGIGMGPLTLALIAWDWSRYWLPAGMETRLFFPDDAWISIPEEGSLATRIAALREWKDARAVKNEERAANVSRWEALEAFDFAGEHLSCENFMEGRWFIYLGKDGEVLTAVPGDKRYAGDPVVDLSKIFDDGTRWHRIDGRTIEFSNASGKHSFTLTPWLDEVDGDLKPASPIDACNQITFTSREDPGIRFELRRDEVNASKFEYYSKQGSK